MPCVWIKEALARKGSKFKIDDICFSSTVSDLKAKLSESSGIDENLQEIIYRGLLLKDDNTLESYGLKDGSAVYIIYKTQPNIPEDLGVDLDIGLEDMIPVLEAAVTSPLYKDKMSALLKNPETLENIVATTPGLIHDPVALTILRDPETLQHLVDSGDISKLAEEHPALVQAASHVAADITKDLRVPQRVRGSSNSEDDDLMDIEPEVILSALQDEPLLFTHCAHAHCLQFERSGMVLMSHNCEAPKMLAQAEMMAANEEQIQNRRNPGGASTNIQQQRQPITSSFFASALQAARANLVSTSTQTASVSSPSTSAGSSRQSQPISSEFFNQAMASALSASTERNNWQSELRQLREMGIEDEALSLRALRVTEGDVQAACDLIFEGFD